MPKSSSLLDTRVIYCGDNLDQLRKLPDRSIDLIYIAPPFNSNRNYEVFWGETKVKRAFEDRHASTAAYIEFMRPRCLEVARVLKKTGSFYYHCDWHASHYVKVMLDQIRRHDPVWGTGPGRGATHECPQVDIQPAGDILLRGQRRKEVRYGGFVLFLMVFMLSPTVGQQPTYEQTGKWIVSKITDEAGDSIRIKGNASVAPISINTTYEKASMDDCQLKYSEVVFDSGLQVSGPVPISSSPTVTTYETTIPLAQVTSVEKRTCVAGNEANPEGRCTVDIKTSGNAITKRVTEKKGEDVISQERSTPTDAAEITFGRSAATNEDNASRLQKALIHAAALCANTKSPF